MTDRRTLVTRGIAIAFYALVVVFLAIYLSRSDWTQLSRLEFAIGPFIAATVVSLAFRYLGVLIWVRLLVSAGAPIRREQWVPLALVYSKSWMGRYIPGVATWIAGKVWFASRLGISKRKLATTGLLEGAIQLMVTLIVGVCFVLLDPRVFEFAAPFMPLLLIALAVSLVALAPSVFQFVLSAGARLVLRKHISPDDYPRTTTQLAIAGLFAIGTLIGGAANFLLLLSIYPQTSWGDLWIVIGTTSLASALSLLAVFAPGGLGVREGVLAGLLSIVTGPEIAIVYALVSRIWSVAVDLLFLGGTWIHARVHERRHSE